MSAKAGMPGNDWETQVGEVYRFAGGCRKHISIGQCSLERAGDNEDKPDLE